MSPASTRRFSSGIEYSRLLAASSTIRYCGTPAFCPVSCNSPAISAISAASSRFGRRASKSSVTRGIPTTMSRFVVFSCNSANPCCAFTFSPSSTETEYPAGIRCETRPPPSTSISILKVSINSSTSTPPYCSMALSNSQSFNSCPTVSVQFG